MIATVTETATEKLRHEQEKKFEIQIKRIDNLTPRQLYKILALRFNTFVLEQQSIFPEFDDHDYTSQHIFIQFDENIAAYARVFSIDDKTATFGRVAVDPKYRGKQLGRIIVEKAIETSKRIAGTKTIRIEAQAYLQKFYESFGFVTTSEPFDDAGVLHIAMELPV